MKIALYIVSLLLSLLNLVAGLAVLIWQHTFSTGDTLQVITDFLFGVI
jgi:type III secretory pathway component EscV